MFQFLSTNTSLITKRRKRNCKLLFKFQFLSTNTSLITTKEDILDPISFMFQFLSTNTSLITKKNPSILQLISGKFQFLSTNTSLITQWGIRLFPLFLQFQFLSTNTSLITAGTWLRRGQEFDVSIPFNKHKYNNNISQKVQYSPLSVSIPFNKHKSNNLFFLGYYLSKKLKFQFLSTNTSLITITPVVALCVNWKKFQFLSTNTSLITIAGQQTYVLDYIKVSIPFNKHKSNNCIVTVNVCKKFQFQFLSTNTSLITFGHATSIFSI